MKRAVDELIRYNKKYSFFKVQIIFISMTLLITIFAFFSNNITRESVQIKTTQITTDEIQKLQIQLHDTNERLENAFKSSAGPDFDNKKLLLRIDTIENSVKTLSNNQEAVSQLVNGNTENIVTIRLLQRDIHDIQKDIGDVNGSIAKVQKNSERATNHLFTIAFSLLVTLIVLMLGIFLQGRPRANEDTKESE